MKCNTKAFITSIESQLHRNETTPHFWRNEWEVTLPRLLWTLWSFKTDTLRISTTYQLMTMRSLFNFQTNLKFQKNKTCKFFNPKTMFLFHQHHHDWKIDVAYNLLEMTFLISIKQYKLKSIKTIERDTTNQNLVKEDQDFKAVYLT